MELTNENIDNYFLLIKNSHDNVMNCFGKFDSEESANEIIEKIYKSRYFNMDKIVL